MFSSFSYDAEVAVVEINPQTGTLKPQVHDRARLRQHAQSVDCALPALGALAHGSGSALYKELLQDENGQPLAASFKDYFRRQ
jgi:CO/xanthine dehydrogenase Mo-binding subunit